MALLVHGIVAARGLTEPDESGAICVAGRTLQAICTRRDPDAVPFDDADAEIAAAMAHHDRLVRLSERHDVLPVRFGTVFSGAEPLRAHLDTNAAAFAASLKRISGCQEFGIRIGIEATPNGTDTSTLGGAPASGGRQFLRQRRALRDRRSDIAAQRTALVERVTDAIATCARDLRHAPRRDGDMVEASVLVSRTRAQPLFALHRTFEDAMARLGLSLAIRGPWPAYSFCAPEDPAAEGLRDREARHA